MACEKDEGVGGKSTLSGKILVKDFKGGQLVEEYYGAEERVYIIYGEGEFFNDDTRTNPDGTFRFEYLQPGYYRVFAYSDCDSCAGGTEPIFKEVVIPKHVRDISLLEDLIIIK
jgi:hypothetical protein